MLFYREKVNAPFRLIVSVKVIISLNVIVLLKHLPSSSVPNGAVSLKVVAQFDTGVRVFPLS